MINLIKMPGMEESVKTFDSLASISNNLLQGRLAQNIFYLHIYKCGGTSIAQAIKSCYLDLGSLKERNVFHLNVKAYLNAVKKSVSQTDLLEETINNDYLKWKFQENLLLYHMQQKRINYITGHFRFSETAYQHFSDKYAFITVLRDPIKRWISAYFYRDKKLKESSQSSPEITELLKSKRGRRGGSLYVHYLGGFDKTGDYTSERAIARAKENLHKFSIVGFLEYKEDFLQQFEEKFGRRLNLREFNRSPKPKADRKLIVTQEIEAEIRAICQPDIEIYQYALDNFVKCRN